MTGVYIGDGYDGYTGNQGSRNVYSDNGKNNPFIFDDLYVPFPWLTTGEWREYANYLAYIKANAYDVSKEGVTGTWTIKPLPEGQAFEYSDGENKIGMSLSNWLQIEGMIFYDGDVVLDKRQNEKAIIYSGRGTLTARNVTIKCNLLTFCDKTFPQHDFIGVMATDTISFELANINVMGVFYAEKQLVAGKQTNVAGSFVSDYFNMGRNVPAIYQVPDTAKYLPPGMIGSERAYGLRKLTWREI